MKQLCVHGVAPGELELAAAVLRKQANARLEDVRSVAVHARKWLLLTRMRGAISQGTTSSEELVADVEDALATGSVMMDAVEQVQACIIALSTVSVEVSSACWCDMLSLECTSGHRARMRAQSLNAHARRLLQFACQAAAGTTVPATAITVVHPSSMDGSGRDAQPTSIVGMSACSA